MSDESGARRPVGAGGAKEVQNPPAWLLRHRTTVPERSAGFFRRPALVARAAPTVRRLTLLVAPGGFGKTTLLGECCRDALDAGVPVAWVTLADIEDDAAALDVYLAHAARQAGLDVLEPLRAGKNIASAHPRTDLLLTAVEALDGPFVLVLDEAERLASPAPADAVNHLLSAAPPNLHVAIAARELPSHLDVTGHLLADSTAVVTTDDLRFSRDDIAGFFDHDLSRRELAAVASASAGWPIALRIRLNERRAGSASHARVFEDAFGNWIEVRLWENFEAADRELLLDAGLFDWFDASLFDYVLGEGAMQRLDAMRTLDGLLEAVRGGTPGVRRLHPLIRDYCVRSRRRNAPERYRAAQVRMARALAARGRTVEAMHHAADGDDGALAATILVEAGGVRLGLREDLDQLVEADGLVGGDDVGRHARLVPARSAALAVTGSIGEARRLFASQPAPRADDRNGAELYLDRCLARAIIAHFGCESGHTTETHRMLADAPGLAAKGAADVAVRIGMDYLWCVGANLHGNFDDAMEYGYRVRGVPDAMGSSLAPAVEIEFGLAAMAQGRVDEALFHYGEGQRLARARFPHAPILTTTSNLLVRELGLERDRPDGAKTPTLADLRGRATLGAYFAAADIATETALDTDGPQIAIATVDGMRAHALHVGLPALARHLAAVRAGLLADAGLLDRAERTWTEAGLPGSDAACIDLGNQSWRELESLSCARLRLLAAKGRFDAGRAFAETILSVARERRLRRTEMRVRALAMKLEHRAGDDEAALAHLREFLCLFAETRYARALVRENEAAAVLLGRLLAGEVEPPGRGAAEALLAVAEARAADACGVRPSAVPSLSKRELEVLRRLEDLPDADIAAELGISRHGVRYHVGNLFKKLHSRNRRDAVRRARAIGIVPPVH